MRFVVACPNFHHRPLPVSAQLQALKLDAVPSIGRDAAVSKAVVLVRPPQADRSGRGDGASHPALLAGSPAPLLPVANRPLLLHALDAILAAELSEVAVITNVNIAPTVRRVLEEGWRSDRLHVELIDCPAADGLRAGLAVAASFVGQQPFLLHLADNLHEDRLGGLLDGPGLGPGDVRVLTCGPPESACSRLTEESVRPLVEPLARDHPRAEPLDHAGVYILGQGAMELAAPFGSLLEPASLIDALGQLGGSVSTHPSQGGQGGWRLGNRVDGWLEGNRIALERLQVEPPRARVLDSDIQGKVAIDPSAEVRSCVLRGPAVIGPMARLSDAYVGPYSSVGTGVRIEAAEIEHSIILPGASIKHLGVRLEASIIGAHARVFRDFRLPRALRLNLGDDAEVVLD